MASREVARLVRRANEQDETVRAVSDTVLDIKETVDQHTETLATIQQTLVQHGEVPVQQGEVLAQHASCWSRSFVGSATTPPTDHGTAGSFVTSSGGGIQG